MKDIVIKLSDGSVIQRGVVNTKFDDKLVDSIVFDIHDHLKEPILLMKNHLNDSHDFIVVSDLNKNSNDIEDIIINKSQIVSIQFLEHLTKNKAVL